MANTKSAKKAIRGSAKKRDHNLFWKRRIRQAQKNIQNLLKDGGNTDILKENLRILQKLVDKAAKKQVIHKNKANRIKARYAQKITAHGETKKPKKATKTTGTKKKTGTTSSKAKTGTKKTTKKS